MSILGTVIADLREGYGVEDIAVRNGIDVEEVRGVVADMREKGSLDAVLKEVRRRLRIADRVKRSAAERKARNAPEDLVRNHNTGEWEGRK